MSMAEVLPGPSNDDRIKAALWFADRGFGVFSCWSTYSKGMCRCPEGRRCQSPGKHPISGHGFKDATRNATQIMAMLSAASNPNYGLVCPEGIFVLDVDGDGVQALAELEFRLGELPPTLRTQTANGQHVFLRWPADAPRPIGQLFGYVTRWGSGSDAGYVIGPRSVHQTGFEYAPAGVFEIATLPDEWVHAAIKPRPELDDGVLVIEVGGYQLPEAGYSGSRYKAILSYIASRYMRGLSKAEIWAGVVDALAPLFAEQVAEEELRERFERAWKDTPARLGEPVAFDVTESELPPAAEPSPDVATDWPTAPADAAYHGVIGEIVHAVQEHTEADPIGILGTLLTVTGVCMGRWRTIYQGATQSANLFVALVGDSSTGRKGTATSVGRDVMRDAYPDWERLIVAGLGSGEGLIGRLGKEDADHRALVMESEFGRLLTVMDREGSTLSPVVRDAWDGVPMGRFIAKEQALVTWHHVGILAHVTPIELRQKLTSTDAANGFGNRFLWLSVKRTRLLPFPKSPAPLVTRYLAPLRDAIDSAQTPGELRWSPEASRRWEWLYGQIAATRRTGLSGSLLARAEAQIVRLALLYALLDRAVHIGEEHLIAAEALWAYAERSTLHIFGTSTGNKDADALLDLLAEGPMEWEAAKKAIGCRHAADLATAVGMLRSARDVEVVPLAREGGGRPRRVIRLAERVG